MNFGAFDEMLGRKENALLELNEEDKKTSNDGESKERRRSRCSQEEEQG